MSLLFYKNSYIAYIYLKKKVYSILCIVINSINLIRSTSRNKALCDKEEQQ